MGPITSLRDIPRILRRQWRIVALILLIGLPLALNYALSQPRVYEAIAVVQIEAAQVVERLTNQSGGTTGTINPDSELDLIEQQLMSRDNVLTVLNQFDLWSDDHSMTERVAQLREAVSIIKLIDPEQAWRPEVHPSGLVITVRLGDPQIAADVANVFLERVLAEAVERTSGRTARTLEFLVSEETRLGTEIDALEYEYSQFQQENAGSLPAAIATQRTQLASLVDSRIAIETQIIELENATGRLLAEAQERQSDLLNQRLNLVLAAITDLETAIAAAPEVQRQINAYEREITQFQGELEVITTSRAEAAMNQLLDSRNQAERFEVLETAIAPEFAVSASRRKIALAGGIVVTLLALATALAIEILDGRLRSPAQLERELGVTPVIAIPNLRSRRQVQRGRLMWIGGIVAVVVVIAGLARGLWRMIAQQFPAMQTRLALVLPRR
jgi:protein tyrosine kinase modulator